MLLFIVLGIAQAVAPKVHHAASRPCSDHRYPSVHQNRVIVCGDRRQPSLMFNAATAETEPLDAPHQWPFDPTLIPTPRIGSTMVINESISVWETNGPKDDADLWIQQTSTPMRRPLDVGPGDQHHPVSSGDWIAWVSRGSIKLWNTQTDQKKSIDAKTGFNAAPTIHDELICWEFRGRDSIDLGCSNGFKVVRSGHQTHPTLQGSVLFFRENGVLMSVDTKVTKQ